MTCALTAGRHAAFMRMRIILALGPLRVRIHHLAGILFVILDIMVHATMAQTAASALPVPTTTASANVTCDNI